MTPNADRDKETSIPINQATFLMSNMVAQAPDNNQGPWAELEGYLRTLLPANELYIVAGGVGVGGIGSNGGETTTLAQGHVTVPNQTWKVALVLPKDSGDDISRVTCSARTIAVVMPNVQGIRNNPWETYLTSVDAVETLTGYNFFSNLPEPVQRCVEAGINGNNSKNEQSIRFAPIDPKTFGDADFTVTASADSGLPVALTLVSGPATLTGVSVHITGTGLVTIRATQAGDANFNAAAAVVQSFEVRRATPLFSALDAPSIELGTSSVTISGAIAAGTLVPSGSVSVSIAGATLIAPIGADGRFTATLPTGTLTVAGSPYAIAFSYGGNALFSPATATSSLFIADTTAPTIVSITATPGDLGVPNHKMFNVLVNYTATDLGGAPVCSLSVSSNEPIDGLGDGHTSIDWQVVDPHHVQLRAERSGTGAGRIYAVTIRCADASGNVSTGTATVSVTK
jgi:hypothetical protein